MKVASKIIFLFNDPDGFGAAVSDAVKPNPRSPLPTSVDSFELSLERYGIRDLKASGTVTHFIDHKGIYQVSILLMQNYEPPFLVCALNEVLSSITGEEAQCIPTILLPSVVPPSKLKLDAGNSTANGSKVSLYGMQIGPQSIVNEALFTKVQKPPSSMQISHEPLACFLQLLHVLKLPAFVLIGKRSQHLSSKTSGEELELVYEIGELLASACGLCFIRDRISWNPMKKSKDVEAPWRALYG